MEIQIDQPAFSKEVDDLIVIANYLFPIPPIPGQDFEHAIPQQITQTLEQIRFYLQELPKKHPDVQMELNNLCLSEMLGISNLMYTYGEFMPKEFKDKLFSPEGDLVTMAKTGCENLAPFVDGEMNMIVGPLLPFQIEHFLMADHLQDCVVRVCSFVYGPNSTQCAEAQEKKRQNRLFYADKLRNEADGN